MKFSAHSSFYGINQVVYPDNKRSRRHINNAIRELVYEISILPKLHKKKPFIKIFDSFFSDTLSLETIELMFDLAKKENYQIQVILIDPFSNLSFDRIKNGKTKSERINSSIQKSCKGLLNIYKTLCSINEIDVLDELKEDYKPGLFGKFSYWFALNKEIKTKFKNFIEIKYTGTLSEGPLYILTNSAFKGHFFVNSSAAEEPWILSVDDPNRGDDLFDHLNNNYDNLFKESYYHLNDDKHIFIGYDNNLTLLYSVLYQLENSGYKPVFFKVDTREKNIYKEVLPMIKSCRNSLLLFTGYKQVSENLKQEIKSRLEYLSEVGDSKLKQRNILLYNSNLELEDELGSNISKEDLNEFFKLIPVDMNDFNAWSSIGNLLKSELKD